MTLKKQTWHTVNRRRSKMLRKWIPRMRAEYVEAGKPVVEYLKRNGVGNVDDFIRDLDTSNITNELLNLYIDVGVHFANASYQLSKAYIPTMYKKGFLEDKWELLMVNFSKAEAAEMVRSIQQTPRDEMLRIIKNIIADAAESGEGIIWTDNNITNQIARAFSSEWGNAAGWMGRRIAQTETIRASNYATLEGVKNLGVEFNKAWLVARDGKERSTHNEAGNTQTNVPEHEQFVVGGYFCDYPVAPSLPAEESINCRCAVTAFPVEI